MAEDKTGAYIKIAFQLALAVGGFIALKKVAEMFGLIQSKEEAQLEKDTAGASESSTVAVEGNPMLAWNPNYISAILLAFKKKFPKGKWYNSIQLGMESKEYIELMEKIWSAKGGLLNDDEEKAISVFRRIETQYQLSFLSLLFSQYHKKDLLEFLKGFLDENEMEKINNLVRNYPQYYRTKGVTFK